MKVQVNLAVSLTDAEWLGMQEVGELFMSGACCRTAPVVERLLKRGIMVTHAIPAELGIRAECPLYRLTEYGEALYAAGKVGPA